MSPLSTPAARWPRLAAVFVLLAITLASAQVPIAVTLNPEKPGAQIPADFLGLSFEMQRVLAESNGTHFFSPDNQPLIATFKVLGIRHLRVGGNTADRPTMAVPSPADLDALFGFAKAADLKVLYTLRLNQGDPGAAAGLAKYISGHYAAQLDGLDIGNEPNVYSTNFEVFFTEWQRFAAVITAPSNCPEARFCGPGVSPGHEKWSARFATNLAATGCLKYITQHDYAGGDGRSVKDPAAGRDKILAPGMEAHYAKFAANFVPTILSNSLTFRFEEANSFYDGGALDVSDTFASALWALNYQWWWLAHGMRGIDFHTGDKVAARDESKPCRYASFWTATNGYNIHPIGYAEKAFSLGSRGRLISVQTTPPADENPPFAAYAALGDDGVYYVTLINFSHGAAAASYSIQLGDSHATAFADAQIMRLTAPEGDVARKTGVTLGGAEIQNDGTWAGHWDAIPAPAQKTPPVIVIDLPAASAAIVKLTP